METGVDPRPGSDGRKGDVPYTNGQRRQSRLIMVSNRAPLEHYFDDNGNLQRRCNAGGVATALMSLRADTPMTWIANATSEADRTLAQRGAVADLGGDKRVRQIAPSRGANKLFYGTFCNPVLWFLQHSLWDRLQRALTPDDLTYAWEGGYLAVNQTFAEAVVDELDREEGPSRVMLHDYHFYAAPLFIRNLRPDATIQHFVHIPWPGPDGWQNLPHSIVESICQGLLACDSVAFQTERSVENFALTCQAYLDGVRFDDARGVVSRAGHTTRVWANPVSVDIWDLRSQLATPEAQAYRAKLTATTAQRTIVRVDRLDPSKNVAAGFRAYGRLLERHPEWRGQVRFLAFLVPSRMSIPEYQTYADETFAAIDEVNRRFGTAHWTPITAYVEQNRLQALVAMSLYDVLLVNPVVDGMNLVSKEGPVLNERDGALVLSTGAGSYAELRGGALGIDPHDVDGTADALHEALSIPAPERRERAQRLRESVVRHDLKRWLCGLVEDLDEQERGATRRRAATGGGTSASATTSKPSIPR